MSEFVSLPENGPPSPASPPSPPLPRPKREGILKRPLLMGLTLPWLMGSVLVLVLAGWYLFGPESKTTDPGALAFGQSSQSSGFSSVQPVPLQTGGLSEPAAVVSSESSAPENVVKMIREGQEYAAANREAISRLSDTVRAQSVALAALQKKMDELASANTLMANQMARLETHQVTVAVAKKGTRQVPHSPLAGMRLESVQTGMAWVSFQGQTWAVQAGDRIGAVIVQDINAADRAVKTSAGVLR